MRPDWAEGRAAAKAGGDGAQTEAGQQGEGTGTDVRRRGDSLMLLCATGRTRH